MRRVLVGLLLVFLCALVGAWLAWPALTSVVRQRLEDALANALGQPSRIDKLSLSLVPLRVRLGGVRVGAEPAPLGQLTAIEVRLWLLPTLIERRPVLSGRIQSMALDLTKLTVPQAQGEKQAGQRGLFSLRVRSAELEDTRISFAAGGTETVVSVAKLSGAFDAAARNQTVNVSADVSGVRVARGMTELNLTRIQAAGGADSQGLVLRTAVVDGDGVHIAMLPTSMPREYTLSATLDLTRLAPLVDESLHGEAKIAAKLAGDLADPAVDAQLSVADLALANNTLGDIKGSLVRRGESVRLADVEVSGPLGHVTGDATLSTAGAMPIEGSVNLQAVNLDTLLRVAGVQLEMGQAVTAVVGVSGTIQPLVFDVNANGMAARNLWASSPGEESAETGRQLATFEANLHAEAGQGTVRWDLRQPEQNHVTGNLSWQSAQLTGALQAQLRDVAAFSQVLPKQVRDIRLSGQLDGTAALSGPVSGPMFQANIIGKEMTVMGAAVPRLTGEVHIAESILTTSGVKLDTAGGGAELTGAVALGTAPRNDWQLTLHSVDADVVAGLVHAFTAVPIPVSGGEVDGGIRVHGTWAQAAIEGGITLRSVYLGEEPVDRIDVKVSAELPRWTAHLDAVHAASETLNLDGSGDAGSGDVSLASTPFQLGNLRWASQKKLVGTVAIRGSISGKLSEPSGSLSVAASDVGVGDSRLGDVAIEATGRQGEWTISASAFEKALDLNATVRLVSGYPYSLVLQSKALDFGRLISASESLHTALTAQVDLNGLATAWATPNGSVRITQLEVRRDQYEVKAQEPIRIDVTGGRFVIHPAVLAGLSSQLKLGGELALSGEVDLQARGAGDLVLLELIGKPFHSAQGQFNVSVQIRRDVASGWNLSGQGQIREAVLDLGLPVAFADVNGDFLLGGSRVQIVTLDGKVGGGRFHVNGTVSPDEGPNLSWQLQDVAVSTDQGVEAQLAGRGQVQGRWRLLMVSGDVEVLNALYDRNIELKDFLPSFKKQLTPAPQTSPPTVGVRLNLHIHAPGGLHIDNNVAEVELGANLRLAGTVRKPELTGTMEFLNGEVKFKQRTFTITAGTIDFRDHGSINLVLNISAESQIATAEADYTITVTVTGTAENPRIHPSADDPTLSETDILSLITFGQTAAQMQRQGGGINAFDAVALLPTGTVTGPLAKLLGVNRMEIETMQSQTTGAGGSMEPGVTIGKDLSDRLRATVSTTFGAATERNVQLDYRLTRQLSLFGTWEGQTSEQSGAFGGGVKLRYEFRRMPFSLLSGGLEPGTRSDAR